MLETASILPYCHVLTITFAAIAGAAALGSFSAKSPGWQNLSCKLKTVLGLKKKKKNTKAWLLSRPSKIGVACRYVSYISLPKSRRKSHIRRAMPLSNVLTGTGTTTEEFDWSAAAIIFLRRVMKQYRQFNTIFLAARLNTWSSSTSCAFKAS